MLGVASAIGRINDKMDDTNEKIETTNKQLQKIAGLLSSGSRTVKKG